VLLYAVRRLALSVFVVAGVVLLTFLITRLVPGDPAVTWAGARASADQIARARVFLGLNRSFPYQVGHFFSNLAHGDLGTSIRTRRAVSSDLLQAVPASLALVIPALVLAVMVGVPLGIFAARFRGRSGDFVARVFALFTVSMPVFWIAMVLQLVFFRVLHLLPVAGAYGVSLVYTHPLHEITRIPVLDALITGNWAVFRSSLEHMVLPALALAAWPAGVVTRMVRATILETSEETHAQMVRALGFPERAVLGRFALRLALGPVTQVLALVFAYSLVNSFLVESIYNWPGLGSYAAQSITSLDVPAIMGVTLFIAVTYVVLNLLVDIVQAALDPRVRIRS
jgi:peptide/nickel transport system permease protein